jgi:oligopeptide transport system ATP-binding protein
MDLLAELQKETGMGLILITHDLGVVGEIADRIAVMYAGRIVETGATDAVFSAPAMPYTEGLMASIARVDQKGQRLNPIVGAPPDLANLPTGCPFHPRCPRATDLCRRDLPELLEVLPGRRSACHYRDEVLRDH